ncbi:2OG-Fe dioxygenase family protein [Helicobacter sp. MIT 05-5294]|uniref:2OG-Fe dioxygenase family protein n=1 Tax=Helicobacter sp. MIT 05-5294 TaxID=1548150 RepID=UPI000B2D61C2|nr:2OG-Fe dioxygenase family protein [Helicobacter sp. MIT 05-5294]
MIVHHVLVECIDGESATNSPEGIHQDGVDFIVSAFVVESKNIGGGESMIYLEDKKTKVFQTTLKEGQGILQADKNSCLWHEVTPIYPLNKDLPAYRSSIGFDIEIMQ